MACYQGVSYVCDADTDRFVSGATCPRSKMRPRSFLGVCERLQGLFTGQLFSAWLVISLLGPYSKGMYTI